MKTIQAHFRELGRDPTDVELETHRPDLVGALLAQDAQGHDRFTETIDGETRTLSTIC